MTVNPAPEMMGAPQPQPLSPSDERTWALLAHLTVLLNLVTGFMGVFAALGIFLAFKNRSRYVSFQAFQAFLFQLIAWGGVGVLLGLMWGVVGLLSAILVGIVLIPFALIATLLLIPLPVIALVYGVYGAIACADGKDFRYYLVGDWVASRNII